LQNDLTEIFQSSQTGKGEKKNIKEKKSKSAREIKQPCSAKSDNDDQSKLKRKTPAVRMAPEPKDCLGMCRAGL
jgi:hypothetical protein